MYNVLLLWLFTQQGGIALGDIVIILSNELGRLIDDYYKCNDLNLRELIQSDIQLLSEALVQCEQKV